MSLCQKDSETTESIKEAKAISAPFTQEAMTLYSTTIKEAKATCTCSIQEAKTLCSKTIRDAEAWGASQADSLHQTHAKSIQHLEEQAIQEESKSQLDFLFACQAAIQASPLELHGMLVASYHVLMGQAPMSHPFSLPQGSSSTEQVSAPVAPSPLVPGWSPRPKQQHPSPDPVDILPPGRTMSKAIPEGLPSSKQQELPPLHKVLMQSHQKQKVFSWDTSLVREVREEYFKKHFANFTIGNTHGLSDVFWCMAQTAKLLGSAIYEIKEVWAGPYELWQANYALRTLLKGLRFLRVEWYPCWSPQRLWA